MNNKSNQIKSYNVDKNVKIYLISRFLVVNKF